jgi:hypothetical protein
MNDTFNGLESFAANYEYGSWNVPTDSTVISVSIQRTDAINQLNQALRVAYDKDCLAGVKHFYGIVLHQVDRLYSSAQKKSSQSATAGTDSPNTWPAYKVYIPELECRPIPESLDDPVLVTYQDVRASEGLLMSVGVGAIVKIRYDDPEKLYGPAIIGVEGSVDHTFMPSSRVPLAVASAAGTSTLVAGGLGPPLPPNRESAGDYDYPPGSDKMKTLLKTALGAAKLPLEWADWQETHNILKKESDGKVGIPNYTYQSVASNIKRHPEKWKELIWPLARADTPGTYKGRSTATGLGQLLSSNVKIFYPTGVDGIGKALPEAVGFVKYLYSRYGDPRVAWSVYGKGGKGALAVSYVNSRTGKSQKKGFKEGY